MCGSPLERIIAHDQTEQALLKNNNDAEPTHPIYASLDHPLFAFGGKRVEKKEMKTPSMREAERGVTSAAMSG